MTIRLFHKVPEEDDIQVIEEKEIVKIEFEDQRYLNNGMWLHLIKKDPAKDTSIEFEPDLDWFDIIDQ